MDDVSQAAALSFSDRLAFGTLCRAMPGQQACGDAFRLLAGNGELTLLVADGLGHGPEAAKASTAALESVSRAFEKGHDLSLTELMQTCHRALAGTRGAAVGLCRLAPAAGKMRFCGIGNIALSCHPDRRGLGISLPGVVGYRMRKVVEFETTLAAGDLIAVYSDGISSRIRFQELAGLTLTQLMRTAEKDHAKDHDDATLVVVRVLNLPSGNGPL